MSTLAKVSSAFGLVLLAACTDRSPTPAPSPTSTVVPNAIQLQGPAALALSGSVQYRVIASFADGTTRDVTSQSSLHAFLTGNAFEDVVRVEPGGLVTAVGQGEVDLRAYHPPAETGTGEVLGPPGALTARLRVLALETGTFRVSGVVTESGQPFSGVRVAVASGKRAGLSVVTDHMGRYALYGLAGAIDLAVSAEAFQTQTHAVVVTDHQAFDFSLQPLPGYDSLAGDWRLTLDAAPTCATELPPEVRTRTVVARITQRGHQLTYDFISPSRVILNDYPSTGFGGISGDGMSFYLQTDGPGEQHPPRFVLLEMLEPRRFLGIAGSARGQRVGNTMTGTLSGSFSVYRSAGTAYPSPGTVLEANCFRKIGEHEPLHTFRFERN